MACEVYIVIGCDTDPDRVGFLDNVPSDSLTWRGMLEGIPRTKEMLKTVADDNGKYPVFTWCLRVDHQIEKIHGSFDYILNKHKDFFTDLEKNGDELGWHPHFLRYDDVNGKWYQEHEDIDWQVKMLRDAYEAYMKVLPGRAKSVRMGWDYHNNDTFRTLQELGVETDFSGIPGLTTITSKKHGKTVNLFDWSLSPARPYYGAKSDYRREAVKGEEAFTMLEAPSFVSRSLMWGAISGLVFAKKMKDFRLFFKALKRPTYWINITGKPSLYEPIIKQLHKTIKTEKKIIFVTYFHPDELLPNNSNLYALEFMKENLETLLRVVRQDGGKVNFIKACEIKKYW